MALDHRPYLGLTSKPYFAYGSLMDSDIFAAVAGVALEGTQVCWAPGWSRTRFAHLSYPILSQQQGRQVFGLLLPPLSAQALARMQCYESADYNLTSLEVITHRGPQEALVFLPSGRRVPGSERWDLATWRQDNKAMLLWVQSQVTQHMPLLDMDSADAYFDALEAAWFKGQREALSPQQLGICVKAA